MEEKSQPTPTPKSDDVSPDTDEKVVQDTAAPAADAPVATSETIDPSETTSSEPATPPVAPASTPAPTPPAQPSYTHLLTPVAILLAGAFIGTGIYFSGGQAGPQAAAVQPAQEQQQRQGQQQERSLEAMAEVTEDDHIKGDPNAPIKIVEYSDFECPFCKRFHGTMNQIMDEYGASGEVAWVYRHFPLEQLHPVKARQAALASECAAEQGGDEAFWQFTDRYYEVTLTNNRTDTDAVIPEIAGEIGLDVTALATCVEEERYAEAVAADLQNAIATGGRGTPWSIIVAPDGSRFPINGAQPYESVVQAIEQLKAR